MKTLCDICNIYVDINQFEEHLHSHNLTLKDYFRNENINELINEEYLFLLSIKKENTSFQYSLLTYMKDKPTFNKSINLQKLFHKIVPKPQEYLEQFETILDETPVDPEHDILDKDLPEFYHCKICSAQFIQSIHFNIVHNMTLDEYMEKFYHISPKIKDILFTSNYNCLIQLIESYSLESFEVENYSNIEIYAFLQHFYEIHNYNLNKIEDSYGIDFFPFIQAFDLSIDYLHYIFHRNDNVLIPGINISPEYKREEISILYEELECPICHETFKINGMKKHLAQIHDISIEEIFYKKYKVPYIKEKIDICSYQDFMFLVKKKQEMNLPYPLIVYILYHTNSIRHFKEANLSTLYAYFFFFFFKNFKKYKGYLEEHKNDFLITSGIGVRIDLNGKVFRSGWEANIARVMNYYNIKWEYEPKKFSFKNIFNFSETFVYIPDFQLNETTYVQIKGRWLGQSLEKVISFKAAYPSIKLHLIDKAVYQKYKNKYKNIISEWA